MSLTKERLVHTIYNQLGYSKRKSIDMIETVLEIMKRNLENGEDVLISGFGKFCVNEKRKRMGRNPKTGEGVPVEARRVITFRWSPVLREKVNRK